MTFENIIRILIYLGLLPMILGMLYTRFSSEDRASLTLNYVSGLVIMLAVMQLVVQPMISSGTKLTAVVNRFTLIILALALIALAINVPILVKRVQEFISGFSLPLAMWIAIVLILFQAVALGVEAHIDEDDAFYVTMATEAYQTDDLYVYDTYTGEAYADLGEEYDTILNHYILSPFPIFNAVISRLIMLHPAITAHTVFPLIFIPFAYMIYALIGWRIFKKEGLLSSGFLLLVAVGLIFSGYSNYTQGTFLLTRVWQGKSLLCAALLPAVFYYGFRAYGKDSSDTEKEKKKIPVADVVMLAVLMLACCHVSSMGIMLGAIAMGLTTIGCLAAYRKLWILPCGLLACIPNIVYICMYLKF